MNRGIMVTRDDPGVHELVLSARLFNNIFHCVLTKSLLHTEGFVHQMVVMKYVKDWSAFLHILLKRMMKYVKSRQSMVKNSLAFVTFTGKNMLE